MGTGTSRVRRTSRRTRLLHTGAYLVTSALLLTGWWLVAGGEGRPSPVARLLGAPDTRVHVWFGWILAALVAVAVLFGWRGIVTFVRETFRVDRGDARWWARWPTGALTGRFARHEGHFDPGQRVANVMMVGGLVVLVGTGIAMTMLHGGPTYALLVKIHRWTTYVVTPVIVGHVIVAIGVLRGYRGVWRAMHLGGRVSEETARRVWPAWAESAEAPADRSDETAAAEQADPGEEGSAA